MLGLRPALTLGGLRQKPAACPGVPLSSPEAPASSHLSANNKHEQEDVLYVGVRGAGWRPASLLSAIFNLLKR